MKKLVMMLAAASCLLSAGEAAADRYGRKAAAAVEAPRTWSGFYLGVGGGAGAVVHDLSVDIPGVVNILSFDGIGGEGIFGTVIVGYDQQVAPGFVIGIFADYDFSGISTDLSLLNGLLTASLDHNHSWSIGGRAGFLSSPSTLWYGTIGYTQADYELSSNIGSLDLPTFDGYFVGAGVESQLGAGFSLRAEYRYTHLDSESLFSIPGLIDVSMEPSMHTARVALTYKFHRHDAAHVPLK